MGTLSIAGLYVGKEKELYPPGPSNPTGFWENARASNLNHRILEVLGFSSADVPVLKPGWETLPDLEVERHEARALIADAFDGQELWGWKEARNSVLLPFWQQLLPPMRYVICLRNPVDMAASAVRFAAEMGGEIDDSTCFALWKCYVTNAIANTSGHPRIFVDYDDYFGDWQTVVDRLARFAGLPTVVGGPRETKIRELFDHGLRHHHTASDHMLRDNSVPANVREIYARLRSVTASNAELPDGIPSRSVQGELDKLAWSRQDPPTRAPAV